MMGLRDGHGGDKTVRWAKGYNIETVSPRALDDATRYVLRQAERHPGEAIIREAARPLGWTEGRGTEQKIGLAAAFFALAIIVVIGIVAAVLVVTGQ